MRSRRVVERRHYDAAVQPGRHSGGDVEQHHGIETTRDGKHRALAPRECSTYLALQFRNGSRWRHQAEGIFIARRPLCWRTRCLYLLRTVATGALVVNSNGPLGILWVGI